MFTYRRRIVAHPIHRHSRRRSRSTSCFVCSDR